MSASNQARQQVQKIYLAFYGRAGDPGGLEYWAELLDAAGGNLAAIIDAFANSAEFQEVYGDLSLEELINGLYQQLFGHDADEAGLEYYVRQVGNGRITFASVALDILNGAQNDDEATIGNRIDLAEEFTLKVKIQNKAFDEEASIQVKAMLHSIGADAESLQQALDDVDDAVENLQTADELYEEDEETEELALETAAEDRIVIDDRSTHKLLLTEDAETVVVDDLRAKIHLFNFGQDDTIVLPTDLLVFEEPQVLTLRGTELDVFDCFATVLGDEGVGGVAAQELVDFFAASHDNRIKISIAPFGEDEFTIRFEIYYDQGFVKVHSVELDQSVLEEFALDPEEVGDEWTANVRIHAREIHTIHVSDDEEDEGEGGDEDLGDAQTALKLVAYLRAEEAFRFGEAEIGGDQTNNDSDTVDLDLSAVFGELDPASLDVAGLPGGLSMDAFGVINGTIDSNASDMTDDDDNTQDYLVEITDNGDEVLSFVWTVNNILPEFDADDYEFSAPLGTPDGDELGMVAATDGDNDAAMIFGIASGNESGLFAIDASSGAISVTKDIAEEDLGDYELEVEVDDDEGGVDTTTVRIHLTEEEGEGAEEVDSSEEIVIVDQNKLTLDPEVEQTLTYAVPDGLNATVQVFGFSLGDTLVLPLTLVPEGDPETDLVLRGTDQSVEELVLEGGASETFAALIEEFLAASRDNSLRVGLSVTNDDQVSVDFLFDYDKGFINVHSFELDEDAIAALESLEVPLEGPSDGFTVNLSVHPNETDSVQGGNTDTAATALVLIGFLNSVDVFGFEQS